MRRLMLMVSVLGLTAGGAAGLSSCGGGGGGGTGAGGGRGGGSGGGAANAGFTVTMLDAAARNATYFAMAVDPAQERVGVAYYTPAGTETQAGHPDYSLKYVEYRQGVVSTPQTLRTMQRMVGLALAFEPTTGDAVVAYLGGAQGFVVGESIFWFQSDAVYRRRSGGTWGPEVVVAENSGQVPSGDPDNNVSDKGFLVGLWPTLLFDSTGKLYFAYRDGHNAQFPQQDWDGSDAELWSGTLPTLTGTMLKAGGKDKLAWGGHLQLVMGATQPAIIYDQMFLTPDGVASGVWFQERQTNGGWSTPAQLSSVTNTQTGGSLAFDATEGFGLAVTDGASSVLTYRNRNPANGVWSDLDQIFGSGSGGWYPSLAMDPNYHEPAVAFYVCSPRSGTALTSCPDTEDELRVSQRISGNWQEQVVDVEGGWAPKIGFFASGKRFVVYRHPPALTSAGLTVETEGQLKIAVEQ